MNDERKFKFKVQRNGRLPRTLSDSRLVHGKNGVVTDAPRLSSPTFTGSSLVHSSFERKICHDFRSSAGSSVIRFSTASTMPCPWIAINCSASR